jgi:hypothetical protein
MTTVVRKETSATYCREQSAAGMRGLRPNAFDKFALFNLILFAVLASSVYWDRFLQFKSRANLPEFIAYAVIFMAAMVVAWIVLRPLNFSARVLAAFQVGLFLHFAGGLFYPGGMRLYDHSIGIHLFDYPLRYDKIVHLVNAFIGCIVTLEFFRLMKFRAPRALVLTVVLVVVGAGALIEIIEYAVVKTIPHNGVGDYDNNMTDLLANLAGCLAFAAFWAVKPLRRRFPSPNPE